MNPTKNVLIAMLLGVIFWTSSIYAQPSFKSATTQTIVAKKADNTSQFSLPINWKGVAPTSDVKAVLIVESLTDRSLSSLIKPLAGTQYMFGPSYSNEYNIQFTFLKDSTTQTTELIKLTIKDALDTTKIYAIHTILYKPDVKESPSYADYTLIKPIKELQDDVKQLRRQILEGDTSNSYLGKFIIKDKIITTSTITRTPGLKKRVEKIYTFDLLKINRGNIIRAVGNNYNAMVPVKTKISNIKENSPSDSTPVEFYQSVRHLKEVRLKISGGFFEYIRAITTDSTVFVLSSPISVVAFDTHLNTKIFSTNKDQFVFLGDILELDTYHFFNYFPDDTTYTLTNENAKTKVAQLSASAGLSSMIDFRLYTDLLGTFGEQPNGLVQLEASSKLPLTALNLKQSYFLNFIQPFFKLSKLDSKYDTVIISQNSDGVDVNKMELFQRSFLNLGLKLNLYKVNWRPNNGFSLNVGYNFSSGNVSIGKDTLTKGILHMPYIEGAFSARKLHNFGFDAELRYGYQLLNQNKYYDRSGWDDIMSISTSMFFFPTSRSQDKFFVRFVNYLSFKDRARDFYQLQFGYSLNLRLSKASSSR